MKKIFFITFILLCFCLAGRTQNLVNNPSFEDTVHCPDNYDQIYFATGWDTYLCTSDYYNSCSFYFGVPNNVYGYQLPTTPSCNAYAGLINYNPWAFNGQEFIGRPLNNAMTIGQKYFLSMKVSLSNLTCWASNNLGFLFSTIPYDFDNPAPVNNYAHFNYPYIISDTVNWTIISGSFIADSIYKYIIIGNFFDNNHTDTMRIQNGSCITSSYYYIDDVCISTDSSFCYNYTYTCGSGINQPDLSDVSFNYSPNPAYDIINLNWKNSDIKTINCNIYDMYSRKILQLQYIKDPCQIDVSEYAEGTYILQIISGNIVINKKIIINH